MLKARNFIYSLITLFTSFILLSSRQTIYLDVEQVLQKINRHLNNSLHAYTPINLYPRSYNVDQSVVMVKPSDWTSGFFPGMMWYMYEYSNDPSLKPHAEQWTHGLEKQKYNTDTHDLGFILYNSYGHGYRITKNPDYKEVLLQAAKSLATRYNPTIGCIRSWEHGGWEYPVIIDNMMNLELLFWAAKTLGDKKYYHIAINHANQTLKNHFRENGSSYHVVDYDPETGNVISRTTAQGYSNESSWARGQAWGLYGFTMTYRETMDKTYLVHAEKIAKYFIQNLPINKIPYWDFNAPHIPFEFQDASAAAIAASALVELSQYSEESGGFYLKTAREILETLSSPSFFAKENTNGNFSLMHSIGAKPRNFEVDVPLIYTDYYFLEALLRYRKLNELGLIEEK